ncbi:XamI family restriction endonuclease [Phyllobacterium sp. 0TCS1.6C]|uniref:XamI family restriction endonuclease n=1 Tax=unclassified Phyllobacterium TaxID=2638441 RepID=UPI0022656342|nr:MULTISPECIES: XamI family restriction endonuclease [unclassified Phyllobacterium]MCX8281770.1 XamI family restriction endonuclease [Phyllobacterium sp. 0TCS1.6C]MCX8295305.1 XamI family restriction endonuclease [Phyllobacterium sp. 0TCS1.6A]
MTISNVSPTPLVWTETELETEAQKALEEFVERRLAEPGGKYLAHVNARRGAMVRLFKALAGVDASNPDPAMVRAVLLDPQMFDALRYVTGPPVSEDDLGVLVTRNVKGLNKTDIKEKDDIPVDVLKLICKLADPFRFPWVASKRVPTGRELRTAIASTMTMHAAQALQTERRGHGKIVEQRLEMRLSELGFVKISGGQNKPKKGEPASTLPPFPPRGRITQPSHHPTYPYFYGECVVYGRKVDLFIALATGRMIALEAKDSSSGLNSTKRLLNDTAAKAKHYTAEAGKNIISVALLSGVFKLSDLKAAQSTGLYLVWAHDMDGFVEWIKAQTA